MRTWLPKSLIILYFGVRSWKIETGIRNMDAAAWKTDKKWRPGVGNWGPKAGNRSKKAGNRPYESWKPAPGEALSTKPGRAQGPIY